MLQIKVAASNWRARVSNKNKRKKNHNKKNTPFSYISSYYREQIHPLNLYFLRASFHGFTDFHSSPIITGWLRVGEQDRTAACVKEVSVIIGTIA